MNTLVPPQRPPRVDVRAQAQRQGQLSGQALLCRFDRLIRDLPAFDPALSLQWSADFFMRPGPQGQTQAWLTLRAQAQVPLICQRCLLPVLMPVEFVRDFRFVASEAQAEAEDDEAEEDLLVLSRQFDLAELLEDELILSLPLVPRHDVCPEPVVMSAVDPLFDSAAQRPNPFQALTAIKPARHGGDASGER
ncbi:MAG: DUF177 domain-containing protein [Rhodoferax sp.]